MLEHATIVARHSRTVYNNSYLFYELMTPTLGRKQLFHRGPAVVLRLIADGFRVGVLACMRIPLACLESRIFDARASLPIRVTDAAARLESRIFELGARRGFREVRQPG